MPPAPLRHPTRLRARPTLGLIGFGAFGAFLLPHLDRFFEVRVHDPGAPTGSLPGQDTDLATAAAQEVVLLAVPLARMQAVASAIAPHLRPGTLVADVCSLKVEPMAILAATLPATVEILGTHPLFGPQSGRHGITGLRLALCPLPGGRRTRLVARFLRHVLGLEVVVTTPEAHDRQMAYVQGLTHIVSRIVVAMEVPPLELRTTTFEHLSRMVETVRHDSDALFRTIARDNPYAGEVRRAFAEATAQVLDGLEAAPPPPLALVG